MRRSTKKLIETANVVFVIFTLFALVVSGAGAAQRLFTGYEDLIPATEAAELEGPTFDNVPEEEGSTNMEPDNRPCCEQPAFLDAPLVVKPSNSEVRDDFGPGPACGGVPASNLSRPNASIRSSASSVSSSLGLQFTLVGAKPSGTS